jgi:CheY-like chemotaxis protein
MKTAGACMQAHHQLTLVLVEDDPGHALLIEKHLRRAGIMYPIVHLGNGREALDYLNREHVPGHGQDQPSILMLLDLNMPVLDGYEVLRIVKSDPRTRTIPVAVLTTTDSPGEVERCYQMGCNLYITKPVDHEQFSDAMRKLGLFLTIVNVPTLRERNG